MARHFILLTATVRPNVRSHVALSDPEVRLDQYASALSTWIEAARRLDFGLGVVETSGSPRDEFLGSVPKALRADVTYVNYSPAGREMGSGKGAIEAAAVRAFLDEPVVSELSTVFKVTGRLVVANSHRCITSLKPHSLMARMTLNREYMDTRVVGAPAPVWGELLASVEGQMDDQAGRILERVLAGEVARLLARRDLTLVPFPVRPRIVGASGTKGTRYSPSPASYLATPVERVLRAVSARKQV